MYKVLIVEDEKVIADTLALILTSGDMRRYVLLIFRMC